MAFGFTPKFEQDFYLNELNPQHYLAIALQAAKNLGWEINYESKSGFIVYIGGGIFSTMEEFKLVIQDDSVSIVSKNISSGMYDWGKNKKHVEDFLNEFGKVQSSTTDEKLEEQIKETVLPLEAQKEDILAAPPKTTAEKIQSFFSLFIPKNDFFITPILIDINFIVFILMVISGVSIFLPDTKSLLAWGADFRPTTMAGEWWRLFTSMFLHIGILHIVLNMYALLYIGVLLEPYLGRLRFAAAYIFTGLIASLTSIYWHPLTVSAGASGAIFGMYGVFLAMLTTNIIDKKKRSALFASIGVFVLFNLMNGVKAGIDNAAHIGGLISGLVIGYCYYPSLKKPLSTQLNYLTVGVLSIAVLVTSFVIYHKVPSDDMSQYISKMNDFSKEESIALSVFNGKKSPGKEMLSDIKNKGLNSWNEGLKILDDADKLNISDELKERNSIIRRYCKTQIVKYELLYKAVEQNTLNYDSVIDSCNKQIRLIVDTLKKGTN